MNRLTLIAATAVAAASLVACSRKEAAPAEAAAPPPAPAATAAAPDGGMAMAPGEKMAKGAGTVTAVDAVTGTVTIDHGPIPEANWPAMTMGFKASADIAKSVKVGDKIGFDLKIRDGAGEITAVRKP